MGNMTVALLNKRKELGKEMKTWKMRNDQLLAYHALVEHDLCIMNMPTGWGKSFELCCLVATDLMRGDRKVVVCVPQRVIAKGFTRRMNIELPGKGVFEWHLPQNLCDTTPEKVQQLIEFLREPPGETPQDRVVLVTHMSLSYAFQQMSDEEIAACLPLLTLVIDEAHHVQTSEHGCNQLGKVIDALLASNASGLKIILATAYFFRGDRLPIISDNHLSRFYRYHIPFDEYWKSLQHIKTYSYDFVTYKATPFQELETILKQGREPTIIYCPPEGHKMLLGKPKETFVRRVRRLCEKLLAATPWKPSMKVSDANVVVDLVATEHRAEKIRFIANHGERVIAVLTVGMFREGADWVEAARIIDLVPTGSDQDRLQRFGRLLRDRPGKKHVGYISLFPHVVDQGEEERREDLTKLYAHFHASIVLGNAIRPIKMPIGNYVDSTEEKGKRNCERLDLLGQLNEATQETIIRRSFEELLKLHAEKTRSGSSISPKEAQETVISVLREVGVDNHLEGLAKQVILVMRRQANISLNTDDLVQAGFDKVWATDIFDGLMAYSAGIGGPETLAEIRKVIDNVFDAQWQEIFEKVRALPRVPSPQDSAYWWCMHNKAMHAQGRLSESRARLLESISWWSWSSGIADRWQTQYSEVSAMSDCPRAGTTQYAWVRQQRRLHDQGKLEASKITMLEAIPWWSWATNSKNWDGMFDRVADLPEPPARGTKEYEWVRTQRKFFAKGKLLPDRIARLEQIAWWQWEERRKNRDDGLEELEALIRRGIEQGDNKSAVRVLWATKLGIGEDQIHKYLRCLPSETRDLWDHLGDMRRGNSLDDDGVILSVHCESSA